MASNSFGRHLVFTTFGESHGESIGVILDGVPAGYPIEPGYIQRDLDRRRPGQSDVTTPRRESDTVHIMSGVFEGLSTGHAIGMVIYNDDAVSTQYDNIKGLYRPGHADFSYQEKYGIRDYRGSGRASGRETACRVAAGAIARQILAAEGVGISAGGVQIGDIRADCFDSGSIYDNPARFADPAKAFEAEQLIRAVSAEHDSIGGIIACHVENLPPGLGEPLYYKLDAMLAAAMLGLGGVKGIEFGAGFECVGMRGSEHNDPISPDGFLSNNAGGVLGGISTGQTLEFRLAVKPTSSIAREQHSIDLEGKAVTFSIDGRHDPCLIPRMVPVVEAMTALVLADLFLLNKLSRRN